MMLLLVPDSVQRSRYWHPDAYKVEYIGIIQHFRDINYPRVPRPKQQTKCPTQKNLYIFPMQRILSYMMVQRYRSIYRPSNQRGS